VYLDVAHDACKKGDKLTPEQARLLKVFELMRAEYSKSGEPQIELLDTPVEKGEQMSPQDNKESDRDAKDDQKNVLKTKKNSRIKRRKKTQTIISCVMNKLIKKRDFVCFLIYMFFRKVRFESN